MKKQIFIIIAITVFALVIIQSSPLFSLLDNNCRCIDQYDVSEACYDICDMYGGACDFAMLIYPEGACYGEDCITYWAVYCSFDVGNPMSVGLWSSTPCYSDCGYEI